MNATFWWLLTVASLVWYMAVTAYVSVRGASDIKNMLARLDQLRRDEEKNDEAPR